MLAVDWLLRRTFLLEHSKKNKCHSYLKIHTDEYIRSNFGFSIFGQDNQSRTTIVFC